MKTLCIALLYNERHVYPDPNDIRTHLEADFDDPKTTRAQIKHLENLGYKVIRIEANEDAYLKLYKKKKEIDIALNLSEGIYGNAREAQLPAMLEMLQIPYTGSDPLTQCLGLDKSKTKEVLIANNIPTLPFQKMETGNEPLKKDLKFPLFVKPVAEGSSAGITNSSIVENEEQLRKKVKEIVSTFNEPALVEPYLNGREFSVAMLGNPPEILPIIEPNHAVLPPEYKPIDSTEVKWYFEEKTDVEYLICPAKIDKPLRRKIEEMCLACWKVMNIKDWTRIDIRCDSDNNPYILEFNSPPGIIPPEVSRTSYFPLAARVRGIDYEELLNKIIETALKRYTKE